MSKKVSRDPRFIEIVSLCSALRYSENKTLEILSKEGYNINRRTLYRVKNRIKNSLVNDINDIFEFGILHEHFQAITAIKEGQRRLWELADKEKDPYKSAEIITQVLNSYQFLSAYYLNIKKVMSQHKSIRIQKDIIPV